MSASTPATTTCVAPALGLLTSLRRRQVSLLAVPAHKISRTRAPCLIHPRQACLLLYKPAAARVRARSPGPTSMENNTRVWHTHAVLTCPCRELRPHHPPQLTHPRTALQPRYIDSVVPSDDSVAPTEYEPVVDGGPPDPPLTLPTLLMPPPAVPARDDAAAAAAACAARALAAEAEAAAAAAPLCASSSFWSARSARTTRENVGRCSGNSCAHARVCVCACACARAGVHGPGVGNGAQWGHGGRLEAGASLGGRGSRWGPRAGQAGRRL